jgi:hypothetical protein
MTEDKNPYIKQHSEIRINGGYATVYEALYRTTRKADSKPKIRKTTMPFDLMYAKLSKTLTGFTDTKEMNIIPENCRYYECFQNYHIVAIEEQPAVRTILVSASYCENIMSRTQSYLTEGKISKETFNFYENRIAIIRKGFQKKFEGSPLKLSFPYVILLLCFVKRNKTFERATAPHVFFKRTPIYGFGDPLLVAPLSNVTGEHELCIGSGSEGPEEMLKIKQNLPSIIKYYRKLFWNNVFNTDFQNNFSLYEDVEQFKNYIKWNFFTEREPSFIYTAPFKKSKLDFGGAISIVKYGINNIVEPKGDSKYQHIETTLLSPFNSGTHVEGSKDELIYDITNEYYLNDTISIMAGDLLTLPNNRTILFESFISKNLMEKPSCFRILINNKTRVIVKITKRFINFLIMAIENATNLLEIKTPDGVLQPGDIISFNNEPGGGETMMTIKSIRVKGDNSIDIVNTAGTSFILGSLPHFKKVNMNELYFDTEKFDIPKIKNKECIFEIAPTNRENFIAYGFKAKFIDTNFDASNTNIVARFKRIHSDTKGPQPSDTNINRYVKHLTPYPTPYNTRTPKCHFDLMSNIIPVSKKLPINVGGFLKMAYNPYYKQLDNSRIFIDDVNGGVFARNQDLDASLKEMVSKGELTITSIGKDIQFKVGDNIVVFDHNPLKMLEIRKIIEMKAIPNKVNSAVLELVQFITKNRSDQTETVDYILNHNIIGFTKVRKIIGKFGDLHYGFKIKSKVDSIPCFPKDSTNIIIGFIIDTVTEPMVLLSNAKTLWFSDINTTNFDLIKPSNRQYKTLDHAVIDSKDFKLQCGDPVTLSEYQSYFNGAIALDCVASELAEGVLTLSSIDYEKQCNVTGIEVPVFQRGNQPNLSVMNKSALTLAGIPAPRLNCYYSNNIANNIDPMLLIPTSLGEFVIPSNEDTKIMLNTTSGRKLVAFSSHHRRINV